jgi:hypothetical protein
MQKAIETGSRNLPLITIHTPVIELDKASIVRLGIQLNAPLSFPGAAIFPLKRPVGFATAAVCG